jgi:hypothetical protein
MSFLKIETAVTCTPYDELGCLLVRWKSGGDRDSIPWKLPLHDTEKGYPSIRLSYALHPNRECHVVLVRGGRG